MASLCKSALDQHSIILEEQLAIRDSKERDRHEKLMSAISQAVSNLISTKFEQVISNEVKDSILPGKKILNRKKFFFKDIFYFKTEFFLAFLSELDQMKHQLHMDMSQKLTTTDQLLKENISKLVNSKVS